MPDKKDHNQRSYDHTLLELNRTLGETIGHVKGLNSDMRGFRDDIASLRKAISSQCQDCPPARDLAKQKKFGYALLVAFFVSLVKDFKPRLLLITVKSWFGG